MQYSSSDETFYKEYTERILAVSRPRNSSWLSRSTRHGNHVVLPAISNFTPIGRLRFHSPQNYPGAFSRIPRALLQFSRKKGLNVYDIDRSAPSHRFRPPQSVVEEVCVICLDNIARNDMVRVLPCQHIFHSRYELQFFPLARHQPVGQKERFLC